MAIVGNVWRARVRFRNVATKLLADPDTVKLYVKHEDAAEATIYEYGVDVDLVREEEGIYYVDVKTTLPGRWDVGGEGLDANGDPFAATQDHFVADPRWF